MHPRRAALCVILLSASCEPSCAPPIGDTDVLSDLPKFEDQRRLLCARGRDNTVTRAFCGETSPAITSMRELLRAVDLHFDQPDRPGFSLTANSSSLSARSVSAINPRAVIVKQPGERADASFMTVGYARGDSFVELGVKPPNGDSALYLLRYEQTCDGTDTGCTFEDRLTPLTESGWTRFSLYDETDLKNTVMDCLQCHQPDGPGTPIEFRMQELVNPWTHWMAPFGEAEIEVMRDYTRAHGTGEDFAGIPAEFVVLSSNPIDVENFVKATGSEERNPFPSQVIEDEVQASSPLQPSDNSVPGVSAAWDALYARAVAGEVIPPPYHDAKITDAGKLSLMTESYRKWLDGSLTTALPDIRDVIREDAYAKLSFRPRPGLSGREILVHMCAQCHNGRLDQSLSRARFNALALDSVDRSVKDAAIDRVQRVADDRYRMPPRLFRDLDDEEKALVIEELRR